MLTINIGGVPEYFNLPIYLAIENGDFEKQGIQLLWQDISEGTGRMSQMLADGELDLAVILTEGIIKSIVEGNPGRIIKDYVTSPLLWGVHMPGSGHLKEPREGHCKIAISRFGSGSHLMAYVYTKRLGWNTSSLQFEVINNLSGARQSFADGNSHLFLWEKYTTQPYVTSGEFSRVDVQPTPWPCFVLAAGHKVLNQHKVQLQTIMAIINNSCLQLQKDPLLAIKIMERFDISNQDAARITEEVQWSTESLIDTEALDVALKTLVDLRLIRQGHIEDIIAHL